MHHDRARGAAEDSGDARRLCRGALSSEPGLRAPPSAAQRPRQRDAQQHPDLRHQCRRTEREHHADPAVRRHVHRPGPALAAPLRLRQESGGHRRGAEARRGRGRGRRAAAPADLLDRERGVHEHALQPAPHSRAGSGGRARRAEPSIGEGLLRRGHPAQVRRRPCRGRRGERAGGPDPSPQRPARGGRRPQQRDGDRRRCAAADRRQPDLFAGDARPPGRSEPSRSGSVPNTGSPSCARPPPRRSSGRPSGTSFRTSRAPARTAARSPGSTSPGPWACP